MFYVTIKMAEVNNKPNYEALNVLKGKENEVKSEDVKALQELLKNDDDLFKKFLGTRLEGDLKKKLGNIIADIDPNTVKTIMEQLQPNERKNLGLIFEKLKIDGNAEKIKEINDVLLKTKIELDNFKGQIIDQVGYQSANLRNKEETKTPESPEKSSESKGGTGMSEIEKKNLDKILDGDTLVEEKFNKTERSLRKDFRKAIELSNFSTVDFLKVFSSLAKAQEAMPDWKKEFANAQLTEKEINKIQKGYLAYLEAKKGNPGLSRWNEVVGSLETGLLNEGKSLDVVVTENLNKPISKKERKSALKDVAADWKYQWIMNNEGYKAEIDAINKQYENGSSEHENAIVKFCESKDHEAKKAWNQYLKEQEKAGNQKSDFGKFRVLVDAIKDQSPEEKISTLLTDTNFDGMRNRLDGKGTKRGQQVDLALRMAQNNHMTMDKISENILAYFNARGEKIGDIKTAKDFVDWLSKDINNAKKAQSILMDSPVDTVDIMLYGKDALKKTLDKNGLSEEELKAINDKINTDPATKDLSAAAKETLQANLSGYLLAKMKEPGVDASVNGLGVGVNMPLNEILKGLSLSLGTGSNTEGQFFAGISLAWNTKVAEWKNGNASIGLNAGTSLGVIPVYGFRAGIEQDLNAKSVLGSIDPKSLNSFSAGANLTMIGAIPSYGVAVGFEKNQLKGIEKQYEHIKKEITPILTKLLTKDANGNYPDIAGTLKELFTKSTDQEIKKATENLTSLINMAQGLDSKQAAQLLGEWYAESWRNNAIQGLPKGWKFTGAGLGIQFLAGFMPIASLSATLTKYKNFSYEDSQESKALLQQKILKGKGDETKDKIEKSDFDGIQKQLEASRILGSGEKIEMNAQGAVEFPVGLLNKTGLDIRVNKDILKYLKKENGKITVPAGISYRFLSAARTNGSTSVLDIGYDRNTPANQESLTEAKILEKPADYALVQNIKALDSVLTTMKVEKVKIVDGKLMQGDTEVGKLTAESGIKLDAEGNATLTAQKGKVIKESKIPLSVNEGLNKEVNSVLAPIEKDLITMAHVRSQFDNFKGFLKNAKAMKAEYLAASQELLKMLTDKKFEGLKTALAINKEGKNFQNPSLGYQIMDRLKAVFATISEDQKASNIVVEKLATKRDTEYKKYHGGKSVLSDFSGGKLDFNYVELAKQLSDKPKATQIDNLIGFTAFYRRNAGDARGMSMTAFGQTNVLDKTFPVEEEKKAETKTWILDNLQKQEQQLALIAERIGKIEGLTQGVNDQGLFTKDNVLKLLKEGTLDIGGKKVIVNTQVVKYFLAECANESVGLEIDRVQVVDTQAGNVDTASMTYNLSETMAKAGVETSKITVGINFGGKKNQQDAGYGARTEQEGGTGSGTGTGGALNGSSNQNSITGSGIGTGGNNNGNGGGGR